MFHISGRPNSYEEMFLFCGKMRKGILATHVPKSRLVKFNHGAEGAKNPCFSMEVKKGGKFGGSVSDKATSSQRGKTFFGGICFPLPFGRRRRRKDSFAGSLNLSKFFFCCCSPFPPSSVAKKSAPLEQETAGRRFSNIVAVSCFPGLFGKKRKYNSSPFVFAFPQEKVERKANRFFVCVRARRHARTLSPTY